MNHNEIPLKITKSKGREVKGSEGKGRKLSHLECKDPERGIVSRIEEHLRVKNPDSTLEKTMPSRSQFSCTKEKDTGGGPILLDQFLGAFRRTGGPVELRIASLEHCFIVVLVGIDHATALDAESGAVLAVALQVVLRDQFVAPFSQSRLSVTLTKTSINITHHKSEHLNA